ncbi:MAG: flippase [Patescibacteria group bacterium]
MSLGKKIAKNTIIHLLGKVGGLIFGVVSLGIMTRYLGQVGFGYYVIVVSFLQFFGILVDFGLSLTTVQLLSQPKADQNRIMNSVMSLRVISAFLFLLLPCGLVWLFPWPMIVKFGVLINVGGYFFISLVQTMTGLFQQKLVMWKIALSDIFSKALLVFGIFVCAYFDFGLSWMFFVITMTNFFNFLLVYGYSRQYISWKLSFDFLMWQKIWSFSWPIALSIVFNLLYLRMDTIIMAFSRSVEEVGLYGATYRIIDILTMLPAVFMGIVLPHASQIFAEKRIVDLRRLLQKSFDALMLAVWPIVFGGIYFSEKVMVLVAGQNFSSAGIILRFLIIAVLAIFVTTLFSYAVVAVNRQKTMMWGFLTSAILTLIGYVLLIPRIGWPGAVAMTLFSEFLIMIWSAVLVYREIKFFPSLKNTAKSILSAGLMLVVLSFVKDWPILVCVVIGAVVYFPLVYLLGVFKENENK